MSFLESHIQQYIACKLDDKSLGCELILQPLGVEVTSKRKSHAEIQLSSKYSISKETLCFMSVQNLSMFSTSN